MDPDELEASADIAYWDSCARAIANGDMSIEEIAPNARVAMRQQLEEVNE